MAIKREFGVSSLLGSGLGLIVILTWFFLLSEDVELGIVIATVTAGILSVTFVFVGYWMHYTGIAEETVWTVARWGVLGLAIPTVLGIVLMNVDVDPVLRTLFPGVFINVIAVGGVLGLLLGLVLELHREQSDLRRLNQRNQVLNRVLRHNIRNDMNVMQWHVDLLADGDAGDEDASIDALRRKIQEVVATSDVARRIDELDAGSATDGPVDIVELVEDRIAIVRTTHPDVAFDLDLPEAAWADVDPVFESVVDNLVENAIEHHDGDPRIDISVEASDGSSPVRITIIDDGPGIPDSEVELLQKGSETQLEHSTGLGLWLVKWVVDNSDGDVRIETPESAGTHVLIEVPAATHEDERRPSLQNVQPTS